MHHPPSLNRGVLRALLFVIVPVFIFSSCKNVKSRPGPSGFVDDTFSEELAASMSKPDTAAKWSAANDVALIYQLEDYQPIWLKEQYRTNEAATSMLGELTDMCWDGFDTTQLDLQSMRMLKLKLDTTKRNSVADAIKFDTTLTRYFVSASRFLVMGYINPKKVDSLWYHTNDTDWQVPNRFVSGEAGLYPTLAEYRSQWPTYELLREELKKYAVLQTDSSYMNAKYNLQQSGQYDDVLKESAFYIIRSELPWYEPVPNDTMSDQVQLIKNYQYCRSQRMTGKLDSVTLADLSTPAEMIVKRVKANMERLRWLPTQAPSGNYILVDVPIMELYFRSDTGLMLQRRVVVGKPSRQTPSLAANMTNLVVNPPWGVPPTILKKDVLPGIQKSGKEYLAKKGLKVYDKNGKQVNAASISSKNYKSYTYKQAPGADNALGNVKFNMPNKWDIYLHDTPHREDFGKKDRALSSGCVRVQDPKAMALFILNVLENKQQYTPGRLDTIIGTRKTRWEILSNKIPVYITYLTTIEDTSGQYVRFAKDIYGRDEKLLATIK